MLSLSVRAKAAATGRGLMPAEGTLDHWGDLTTPVLQKPWLYWLKNAREVKGEAHAYFIERVYYSYWNLIPIYSAFQKHLRSPFQTSACHVYFHQGETSA